MLLRLDHHSVQSSLNFKLALVLHQVGMFKLSRLSIIKILLSTLQYSGRRSTGSLIPFASLRFSYSNVSMFLGSCLWPSWGPLQYQRFFNSTLGSSITFIITQEQGSISRTYIYSEILFFKCSKAPSCLLFMPSYECLTLDPPVLPRLAGTRLAGPFLLILNVMILA
jgi:hypothetical protein